MQFGCVDVREHDAHAALNQLLGDGETDATGSTGDHRDIAGRDDIPNDCHTGQSTMRRATSG